MRRGQIQGRWEHIERCREQFGGGGRREVAIGHHVIGQPRDAAVDACGFLVEIQPSGCPDEHCQGQHLTRRQGIHVPVEIKPCRLNQPAPPTSVRYLVEVEIEHRCFAEAGFEPGGVEAF